MKSPLLFVGFLTVLVGCSTTNPTAPSATAPSATTPAQSSPILSSPNPIPSTPAKTSPTPTASLSSQTPTPVSADKTISTEGIGVAKLGMKLGALKQLLGKTATFEVKLLFRVDFDAISITQSGQRLYSILYPTGTTFTDASIIEILFTDNPDYKTLEGVGPGTSLQQAAALYGDATLYYSTSNESREYVKFAKYPTTNIYFRPMGLNRGYAGIYPTSTQEYLQTQVFQDQASIRSVEILCRPPVCPLK